jgi:endoglucanase
MKKIISIAISLFMVLSTVVLPQSDVNAASANAPSELHVEGKYLINEEGEKVRLTGANIPDTGWSTGVEQGYEKRISMLMDQWNANCLRLCVHSKFWFGQEWYQNNNSDGYKKTIQNIIEEVTSRGKYVILNLHEFYAITEQNYKFWEEAAQVYGNNPGVLFGILNEPHDISWDVWKNGGYLDEEKTQRVYGYQEVINMIRKQGAKNICIAGGLDWSYYFEGITKGYDGLEYGYRLEEPEGYEGNGIMYDTHVYPMKPEYNPVEKAIGCVMDEVPILVGEYGHWGERLFDWYDNYICEYPHVWMNEMQDFFDRNELNYTYWSWHTSASPSMLQSLDTYEPTKYSGIYMKYFLLHKGKDERPPEDERPYKDDSPLSTWENTYNFDDNDLHFKVYGDEVRTEKTADGLEGNGQLVSFDIKEGNQWKSAAIADFPDAENLKGAQWIAFRVRGDGDMRNMGIGIELTDGRQFTTYLPLDLFKNWKNYFLPLDVFKGEYGLLDTTMIKSIMFTSLDDGPGSFTLDNIIVGGLPYEPSTHTVASDMTEKDSLSWKAWEDTESVNEDSFTITTKDVESKTGKTAVKITYDCPEGSYGGQARATIPESWDLTNKNYISFWAKGTGEYQKFTMRLSEIKSTTANEQRSNFKKREFERFCLTFELNSNEWQKFTFRISDLGMSDMLQKGRVRYIDFFNMVLESSGSLIIDDLKFMEDNPDEHLLDKYEYHEEPVESLAVGVVQTKYGDDAVYQIPKVFEIESGEEAHLSVHLMNKTDEDIRGQLKLEGLPTDKDILTTYEVYKRSISYPHYPWRSYSLSNFIVLFPEGTEGEYEVTVSDVNEDSKIVPYTYKLIVKEKTSDD